MPQLPPGSPFEDSSTSSSRTGAASGGDNQRRAQRTPRRVKSLGSGFVIDAAGIVVTNNHVIADADEINVIFNDGTQAQGRAGRHATPRPISRC